MNIAPFQLTRDSNETAVRWAKWKKNIDRQFRLFGIEDPQLKKDGLIINGEQEIAHLDDSIPDPILEGEQNEYTRLIAKLDQHFLPKKNKDYARFKLGNLVRAETKALIGGCIFIYSRSARRISFEISCHYSSFQKKFVGRNANI